jgi:hypothetical protein
VKARVSGYLGSLPTRVRSLGIGYYSPWGIVPLDVLSWLRLEGLNPSTVLSDSIIEWKDDARELLLSWVDKLSDSKWPMYLEDNSVLRLKDLIVPKSSRWASYNDDEWGVYGKEPQGDLNLFATLQAAVYSELQVQRLDLAGLNKTALDFKWRPGPLEDDLLKYVDLEKRLRLFRSPRQIVHADKKSNRLGLGFQMKLWSRFRELLAFESECSSENPDIPQMVEGSSGFPTSNSCESVVKTDSQDINNK